MPRRGVAACVELGNQLIADIIEPRCRRSGMVIEQE